MTGVDIAIGVAAAAASAAGAVVQAQSAAEAQKYQAYLDRVQAEKQKAAAIIEARRIKEQQDRLLGQQRAALAESGVNVDFGTAQVIQDEQVMQSQRDIYYTLANAEDQRQSMYATASGRDVTASATQIGGALEAGGSLLGSAGRLYRQSKTP